ncbi:MAG: AAA family ATPase [Bacilli bacterium]|nr:AAA family ATPase [Bacilli bacterium]
MKTLILCTAIPASGKSTWSRLYKKEHENVFIVSSDEIRYELTGCYTDRSKQKEVWELFSKRIHEYGKDEDCTVILDALNDRNYLREKYVTENPEFDKYIMVTFPGETERAIKLNNERIDDTKVPNDVMKVLIENFEEPTEEIKKLYDEVWEIRWKESMYRRVEK